MPQLSAAKITEYLPDEYKFLKIHSFDQIDSTNSIAKNLVLEKEDVPFLVIADSQTSGRGRLGRTFYSPASTGIYMSVVVGSFSSPADALFLTPATSVAVTDAILSLTGINTGIKWVNDIYLKDKKICGILAESQANSNGFSIIIGIGINMTTENFPHELDDIADSLNTAIPREQMIAEIIKNLFDILKNPDDKAFMKKYKERSILIGKEIYYIKNNQKVPATVLDIDDNGGLKVQTAENNNITLTGGEITVRLK